MVAGPRLQRTTPWEHLASARLVDEQTNNFGIEGEISEERARDDIGANRRSDARAIDS